MGRNFNRRAFASLSISFLVLAGCGSTTGETATVKTDTKQTSTTTQYVAPTTTTTTLSPAECLIAIGDVQSGTRTLAQATYEQECGALPAGVVLEATTTTTTLPPPTTTTTVRPPPTTAATQPPRSCDPNYSGCVPIDSDVDCAGGSGNGPSYVSGPVQVTGTDIYGLDADNDGYGCE